MKVEVEVAMPCYAMLVKFFDEILCTHLRTFSIETLCVTLCNAICFAIIHFYIDVRLYVQ